MKLITLDEAVRKIVDKHGGVRKAAIETGVDKAFISRMMNGHRTMPSNETLNKLGLRPVALYEVLQQDTYERRPDQPEGSAW